MKNQKNKNYNSKDKFVLFATCIPVKGITRSLLCDMQRPNNSNFIPNILYEILTELQGKSISQVKEHYHNKADDVIDEYFTFLLEKEFIFFTDNPDSFPSLDLKWQSPYAITNAIIDSDEKSSHNWKLIFDQLNALGCEAVLIRSYSILDNIELATILNASEGSRLKNIQLILKYDQQELDYFDDLVKKYRRLGYIIIHSSPFEKFTNVEMLQIPIHFTLEVIDSARCCGVVQPDYFTQNIASFTEAQHHNSCLNRKITIDVNGEIKNCPSMTRTFGNIKDTTFEEVLADQDFKNLWNINKDKILVCKDCEFRYVCTDCRAYIDEPDNILSKPLKCGYNPYIGKWDEWTSNPLKQQVMEYYGMN